MDEGRSPKKFLFGPNEAIEYITRGSYEAMLLAGTSGLDVIREAIPARVTFYVDSGSDWPGFEFIYLLEGKLQYGEEAHSVILEPGCFIARHLAQERAYFQTLSDTVLLHVCSPPAFHVMRSETEEFYEIARRLDADEYVSGHCKRLENLAVRVGDKLGLSAEQMGDLSYAAFFHDIGKARVPKHILQKPGALTDDEWEIMRSHTIWGREMMEGKGFLDAAARIVEQSHERVDGRGYPKGLQGDGISLEARIVAAVDAYDAMTTNRTYHAAMTRAEAIRELRSCAGSQFDPRVVEALIDVLGQVETDFREREEAWLGQELTQLKQREAFLQIGEAILAGSNTDSILNDVVKGITRYTPFNCAIISIYEGPVDPMGAESMDVAYVAQAHSGSEGGRADLRDAYDLSPEQRQRVFTTENRVGRSYHMVGATGSAAGDVGPHSGEPHLLAERFWRAGDLLCIPMWVGEDRMIGMIGVDEPNHTLSVTAQMLEPIEMFANLTAIAVLEAKKKRQLTEMATKDPLTGVYNRHYLAELIEDVRPRVERGGLTVSLLMLDFIDFHRLNVKYGHLEGDRVLREAAAAISRAIREGDVLVRYGGDEFLIVMPEAGEAEAEAAGQRVRGEIRAHDFGVPDIVDIRVGSATWRRGDSRKIRDILEEADRWMYRRGQGAWPNGDAPT